MFPNHARTKWWQLYLIILLFVVLFLFDGRLNISPGVHKAVQIAIVVFIYVLIGLWIKVNAKAFRESDASQYTGSITVFHFHPKSSTSTVIEEHGHRPMLPSPDSHEIDVVNTNSVPLFDEALHTLKKE